MWRVLKSIAVGLPRRNKTTCCRILFQCMFKKYTLYGNRQTNKYKVKFCIRPVVQGHIQIFMYKNSHSFQITPLLPTVKPINCVPLTRLYCKMLRKSSFKGLETWNEGIAALLITFGILLTTSA